MTALKGSLLLVGVASCTYVPSTAMMWPLVIGKMCTPRSGPLAAELPSNVLVVVGGKLNAWDMCAYTEVAHKTVLS